MKRFTPFYFLCKVFNILYTLSLMLPLTIWAQDNSLLVQYPIKDAIGPWPLAANYTKPGINAKRLSFSEALTVNIDQKNQALNFNHGRSGNFWIDGWPSSNHLDLNRYIQFSISPQVGYAMNVESLQLAVYSGTTDRGVLNGPAAWELHAILENPVAENQHASGWRETLLKGMASMLGADEGSKTILHTQKIVPYQKSIIILDVDTHDNRLLTGIRPGSTIIFRLYGYAAKSQGQGGFVHIGRDGSDIMIYGSLIPLKSCRLHDIPVLPSVYSDKMNFYLVDGTWGHETGGREFASPSHVAKLIHLLKGIDVGSIFYFRGPGNEKDSAVAGQYAKGAFGSGSLEIAEHIYHQVIKNYNEGHAKMSFVGWSRGAAIIMQVLNYIYYRGIPNKKKGGYYINPNTDCLNVYQVHLLDTVHSMGVPGNDINHGWYDKALPPNIGYAWHYLADTENYAFGFKQTRPSSAIEIPMCRHMGILPSHGDIGGSTGSLCSEIVLKKLLQNLNSLNKTYTLEDYNTVLSKNMYNEINIIMYSTLGSIISNAEQDEEESFIDIRFRNSFE